MTTGRPISAAAAVAFGLQHHQAGRISDAVSVYRQVLAVDPDNFDALHLLGVATHQGGDHAAAAVLVDRALARNPSSAAALNSAGQIREALQQPRAAREYFEKALTIQPDFFEAINNLGGIVLAEGDADEALRCFRRAAHLKPDAASAYYNAGLALQKLHKWPEAVLAFREAWVREPTFFSAPEQFVAGVAKLTRDATTSPDIALVEPVAAPQKVSVALCSIDDRKHDQAVALYEWLYRGLPHEIIVIKDARSLAEAYNRAIAGSDGEIVVLSHDDIDILATDFPSRLERHLKRVDAVGVIGATKMRGPAWGWCGHPHLRGWITHHSPGEKDWAVDIVSPNSTAEDIEVLDGVFLAAKRSVFDSITFDAETFDGFHLYDIDWSYRVAMAGFSVAVAGDLLVVHESRGSFDPAWQNYAERFCAKHGVGIDGPAVHRQVFEASLTDADQVRAFFQHLMRIEV